MYVTWPILAKITSITFTESSRITAVTVDSAEGPLLFINVYTVFRKKHPLTFSFKSL